MSAVTVSFHWADYVVFGVSLAISLGIGFFFCCYGKKQASNDEYLMGGRNINPFSVGLSMAASVLNAVFLIGVPAEIHYRGIIYSLIGVSWLPVMVIIAHVFVPKFREMDTTSAYEYLQLRFNSMAVRLTGSIIFSGTILLFLAVVLYAPALAFSQVTGLSIHIIQLVCGLVCTAYVFAGGMKAVIWTDTVQMIIVIAGTIAIAVIGAGKVGGLSEVWRIAQEDNRINFNNWSSDPLTRHTIWTQVIGQVFIWLPIYGSNQMMIQRYHAVASTAQAQIALYSQLVTVWLLLAMVTICGIVMYAYYRTCDPFAIPVFRKVSRSDQVFPLFMMEVLGSYHGLPGLYTAAVFAAALSSISSAVNSLAAVVLEDFIKPIHSATNDGKPMKEKTATWISKILSLFFGLLTIGLSYIAPLLGDAIIQIPMTIWGVVGAPLFGMFVLAMFFPCANAIGTMCGVITSLVFAFWLAVGGIYYGRTPPVVLPLGVNCLPPTTTVNGSLVYNNMTTVHEHFTTAIMYSNTSTVTPTTTTTTTASQMSEGLVDFYTVSYAWYGFINLAICVGVGLLVSLISDGIYYGCKEKQKTMDANMVYAYGSNCCCCFPRSIQHCCNCFIDHEETTATQVKMDDISAKQNGDTNGGLSNPGFTVIDDEKY